MRAIGILPAGAALRAALAAFAAGAGEGAGEGIAGDRKKLRDREELQLAAKEIFLAGFHIEFAHEALDEEQVDWAAHHEDAVGAGVGHDLHGCVFAGGFCARGSSWGSVGGWCRIGAWRAGTLDAGSFLPFLLGADEFGNRLGDFRDIGVLDLDEAGGLDRARLVDFLFEVDQLADERGVFRDDHCRGIRYGGDRTEGAKLADDLSEGVHRFGGLDVAEGHDIRNDRIAIGQRVIFVVDVDAASGWAEAAGGEREYIEIWILPVGHEDEIFDGCGLAQKFGGFGEGERVLRAGFLDEGKFRIGGGLGNNHAAAGVFAVESGERVAAEFWFDDVFADRVFAEGDAGFRVGRAGGFGCLCGGGGGVGGLRVGGIRAAKSLDLPIDVGLRHNARARRRALHRDRRGCLLSLVWFRSGGRNGWCLREQAGARGKDQGDDADEGHKGGVVERGHFSGDG